MLQRRVSPARRYVVRTLRIVALVGTILIGIIALALIASQTSWFKDWLRGFAVREANQYVNGTVSVGSLGGNLLYGVQLGNVEIDMGGEQVVAIKQIEIKYSIGELIASGMTVREIRLDQPFVLLRHTAAGWNLAQLVKRQQQEANRTGPSKPLSLPNLEIVDGRAVIDDRAPSPSYRLPKEIDAVNVNAGYQYEPVHYSLTLNRVNFAAKTPDLSLQQLSGRLGERNDDINIQKLTVKTPQSSVTIDGDVRNYSSSPAVQLTLSAPALSMPEFSGVLPSLHGYDLHPSLDLKASGPENALQLTVHEKSEAGAVDGALTADVAAPGYGARGAINVRDLNLAPVLNSPADTSDITGHVAMNLRMAASPANAPALDRVNGRVSVDAPLVAAAGYRATDVKLTADLAGRRVTIDGRAAAYGGTATATGLVVAPAASGQALQFDLTGSASHLNLANLPRTLKAPRAATNINVASYHAAGTIGSRTNMSGGATLGRSTVPGATVLNGTAAQFAMSSTKAGLQSLAYSAHGGVRHLNAETLGHALQIASIATPNYA
ncbi:MAG: AsmA family protein, partial [Vicinamibacterales bacterium]